MPDAVEAPGQDMQLEAADELAGGEHHGALARRAVATVIRVVEGDAGLIHGDQSAVGDGEPHVCSTAVRPMRAPR